MLSNYPSGFLHGVTVRGVPILQTHTGMVFWVSNAVAANITGTRTGSNGNNGTFASPFSTLDYAVGMCAAGRSDIICVKPGHAETYSSASALAIDVKGIAIVGQGAGTLRPTFTCDTVNTTPIVVSADDCSIQNCIFVANYLTIAGAIHLSTAKNFACQNCVFRDTTAALNFANVFKSTGAANTVDGLYVAGNLYGSIGTTFNTFILTANDINELQIHRNVVLSINTTDLATLVIVTTGVLTNGYITGNVSKRKNTTTTNAMASVGGTTSSVILVQNFASALDGSNNINWVTTTGLVGWGNSYSGAIAGQGFPIPALDS